MNNYYERDDPTYSGADLARAREDGFKKGRTPRVLKKVAEIDALPKDSVIRWVRGPGEHGDEPLPYVAEKDEQGKWIITGDFHPVEPTKEWLPATVLFDPSTT